jgi:hypothetical protein
VFVRSQDVLPINKKTVPFFLWLVFQITFDPDSKNAIGILTNTNTNKMKKILSGIGTMLLMYGSLNAATQVVDLTTGNGTGNPGSAELNWGVIDPNGTARTVYITNGQYLAITGNTHSLPSLPCGRWISPHVSAAGVSQHNGTLTNNYQYKLTFVKNSVCISDSAVIKLTAASADNTITGIKVNGTNHPLNISYPTVQTSLRIALNPSELNNGLNTIIVTVYNQSYNTGLGLCGNLSIYTQDPPVANLGPDLTICYPGCLNLSTPATPGCVYSWYKSLDGGGPWFSVGQNSPSLTDCSPWKGNYMLTVTRPNGCTAQDIVHVNVLKNDPGFSVSNNTGISPNYFTVSATPNDLAAFNNPGFGYVWIVEDFTAAGALIFQTENSHCWWTFNPPTIVSNKFNGFDNTAFNYSGTGVQISNCSSPTEGKFLFNHHYRITRGTWDNICGWKQVSQTQDPTRGNAVVFVEDHTAPDFSYLMNSVTGIKEKAEQSELSIYPNPSNGLFTISLNHLENATLQVYDILGKAVRTEALSGNQKEYQLDLTGYSKGIYLVNILSKGNHFTKKIILE